MPVALSAAPAGHRTVEVTANVRRPARPGHVYWLVLEVHQVGGTHSEFYARQNLERAGRSIQLDVPGDADLTRARTGRIYEVTDAISGRFESGHPDPGDPTADFLLKEPCVCGVSNVVALEFRD